MTGRISEDFIGYGIIAPFRRDRKNDFATDGGVELVRSRVAQILGMRGGYGQFTGELPWNTDLGSILYLLRQRKNDIALQELAQAWVTQSLAQWEPAVRVTRVIVSAEEQTPGGGENVLLIRLWYDILAQPGQRTGVLAAGVEQTVALAA